MEVARQLLPYKQGLEYVCHVETGEVDFETSRGERRRILEGLVFQNFLNKFVNSALACSPDGRVNRLSMHAIRPAIYNNFQTYNLAFLRIGTDLLFVEGSTGTIDISGIVKRWEKAEIDHFPDWWNEISDLLNPLIGWAVCFKRSEVKHSVAEIRSAWEIRTKETKDQKGRPRIQERVSLAYREKFPHGHAGETWKHVQIVVSTVVGVSVSLDTLKRALGLRL